MDSSKGADQIDEEPPVFKSWNGWYWLVVLVLALQILAFYLITRSFS